MKIYHALLFLAFLFNLLITQVVTASIGEYVMSPTYLQFESYDSNSKWLSLSLVSPSIQGDLFLKVGSEFARLTDVRQDGLFKIKAKVECADLAERTMIIWLTETMTQRAEIPAQPCNVEHKKRSMVIFHKNGECWFDIGDMMLWSAAREFSKINNAKIRQNIYAIFLINRGAFQGGDINSLRKKKLRCPTAQAIEKISNEHAIQLFNEMLDFNLVSQDNN